MYLDYNATAPLYPTLKQGLLDTLENFGNPSSIHHMGRKARQVMETAREDLAEFLGVQPRHLIFGASGTEINNTVLKGVPVDHYLIASTEHDCVREPALQVHEKTGKTVTFLPVNDQGLVEMAVLETLLHEKKGSLLVSVMAANNETGVLADIAEISQKVHERGNALLHVDAVQAFGKTDLQGWSWGPDMITLSFHKVGGMKGAAALVVKDHIPLQPLLIGGGQEMRRRAGTENIFPLATIPPLLAWLRSDGTQEQQRLADLQTLLETGLKERIEGLEIASEKAPRLSNTTCALFPHKSAQSLVMRLDLEGIYVSAGSACASGKIKESHVLRAMGYDAETSQKGLRISTGWDTTADDIHRFLEMITKIH